MSNPDFSPITPAALEWQEHTPVAEAFDDPYFSRQDGMAESGYVFIEGNNLPARFQQLKPDEYLVVGETGFGTGLNCLLAAQAFLAQAPDGARLHLISAEKHPLQHGDLERALAHWPSLATLAQRLLDQYPPPCPGFHRVRLHPRIDLTLLYGDATTMLSHLSQPVDAWFLDGFAPACNPSMWQPDLFAQLARLSRPGTTLATFTAAGFVRRGLIEAGFTMAKQKGFGHKRHMLVGQCGETDLAPRQWRQADALVVGAGLAGATTARALAERGWQVTVIDANGIASEASGNLAGVVYSTPSPHLTPQNRFYQSSYGHALRWLNHHTFPRTAQDGALNGVIQHFVDTAQQQKITAAMETGAWPPELLRSHGEDAAELRGGGYLRPARWCRHLLDHPRIHYRPGRVQRYQAGHPVCLWLDDGTRLEADAAIFCTAGATQAFAELAWLPLKHIRGQVSYCRATEDSKHWQQAQCHGGYLTPALDNLHCVGATFDLHNDSPAATREDDHINLSQLRRYLPQCWQQLGGEQIDVVDHRVAFRCQSTDFLPLCGPLPEASVVPHALLDGLYLNIAHGSRGITGTPLCADILADQLSGLPLPADQNLQTALAPERFILRKRKKQPEWTP